MWERHLLMEHMLYFVIKGVLMWLRSREDAQDHQRHPRERKRGENNKMLSFSKPEMQCQSLTVSVIVLFWTKNVKNIHVKIIALRFTQLPERIPLCKLYLDDERCALNIYMVYDAI